jgi:RNA polymerase sigma-70 factor (ECF subfamily)
MHARLQRIAVSKSFILLCFLGEAQSKTVRLVLDAMPRPLREILVLRELEELSYRQISEITDLPIGTVMSRLARARSAFGDAWRRQANNSD